MPVILIAWTGASADGTSTTGCGLASRLKYSSCSLSSVVSNAAAIRLRLARRLGDELDLFRPGALEQHGFVGRLDDRAQFRQRHRLIVDVHLAELDQSLDEAAQPVFGEIEIGGCLRHRRNDTSGEALSQLAPRRRCGLLAPAEPVVQAGAHEVVVHRDVSVPPRAIEPAIEAAEIDVQIFGLGAQLPGSATSSPPPTVHPALVVLATAKPGTWRGYRRRRGRR